MSENKSSAAYVLSSAFEEIEKSNSPDKTKVQILIREGRRVYSGFKVDKEQTLRMLEIREGESKPIERDMKLDKAFRASIELWEKYFNADATIENLGRIIKFYHEQNQFLYDHFLPFFDFNMRLLERIDKKIELSEEHVELEEDNARLNDRVAELENILLEKEKEKERDIAMIESAKKKLESIFNRREEITRWLNVLSNKELFPDPIDARIMAIFLSSNDRLNSQTVSEKLRSSYATVQSRIKFLKDTGVLVSEKEGKETFYSLSPTIPSPTPMPENVSDGRRQFAEMLESQERDERP